jgi:hypothetical protein
MLTSLLMFGIGPRISGQNLRKSMKTILFFMSFYFVFAMISFLRRSVMVNRVELYLQMSKISSDFELPLVRVLSLFATLLRCYFLSFAIAFKELSLLTSLDEFSFLALFGAFPLAFLLETLFILLLAFLGNISLLTVTSPILLER